MTIEDNSSENFDKKYFKIMEDGATLCCLETDLYVNMENVKEILSSLKIECGDIEKIIKIDAEEAFEWYEVTRY
jgi:hypothetical protein